MKKVVCKPNLITYNTIINTCGKGDVDLKKTLNIFDKMQREGVELDQITFNSLIVVCSQGSLWEESQRVFS
jgi:pentatricopeptide repeat protein